MDYLKLAELYKNLEQVNSRLKKTYFLAKSLQKCPKEDVKILIYLAQGRVFSGADERNLGMSSKLLVRALMKATGESESNVNLAWKIEGDLGSAAFKLIKNKKQITFATKKLSVKDVMQTIQKLPELGGSGSIEKKISEVTRLLTSAKPLEAKYIVRIVLEEMRTGIGLGTLRDALVWAFLPKVLGIFYQCEKCGTMNPKISKCLECGNELNKKFQNLNVLEVSTLNDLKNLQKYDAIKPNDKNLAREIYNHFIDLVQHAYNMTNDFGEIALSMKENGIEGLEKFCLKPGIPIKVMLYQKAQDVQDAFNTVGMPAIAERKFDGFRLQIHGFNNHVKLFTRRLDDVTKQFPDVVEAVKTHVKSNKFILDTEIIGIDPKTKRAEPFQKISQRIKRKYDIQRLVKKLPVKVVVFDAMMINGDILLNEPLEIRSKRIKGVIKNETHVFEVVKQLKTSDKKKMQQFYNKALDEGHEGIMIKNIKGIYKPGSRVGYGMKLKPILEPLDLVIVGAEWGEGKRSKWLSSFTLACKDNNDFKEIGKVGTGIKEKKSLEHVSFAELTQKLKPLIKKEKGKSVLVKPKIIVEVNYEEIQKSPSYSSGYALRFPRVIRLREMEKGLEDVSDIKQVKNFYKKQKGKK